MKSTSLLILCLVTSGFAHERPVRGARPERVPIDLKHLAGGVQFKLKREERQGLRGESEHARASRIAAKVTETIRHLTDGDVKAKRVFRHSGENEQKQVDAGLHLWYRLDMAKKIPKEDDFAPQQRAVDAVELLKSNPVLIKELDIVETELKVRQSYTTDDPQLFDQVQSHYSLVNLPEAWEYTGGDSSVVVQVIDSGIDMSHPDLQTNKWANSGETDCNDGIDNDGNGFIDDCQGYNHADGTGTDLKGGDSHGTHCAGIIAADSDNGVGVAGVAGGKGDQAGASLMINVIFGATDTGGFAEALVYGAHNGAHISSNSWGYTIPGAYDSSVLDAIDYADDAGVIVVFAAGNDGENGEFYPGYYSTAIAVAALDSKKEAAYFTNYGDWVDISGPGYPVLSTVSVADGSYDWYSGTSMACPHIAGGLALAKSYSPGASSIDLKACLFNSATEIDSSNTETYSGGLGAGVLDIPALIYCVANLTPTPSPTMTPAPTYPITPSPTPMPVACGTCDHVLTLSITTDKYALESTFSLVETISTGGVCFTEVSGPSVNWENEQDYTVIVSSALCENTEYDFTMFDSSSDGLCCGFGEGFYSLQLDGVNYFTSDGKFDYSETFTISTTPIPSPTISPLPLPTMTMTSISSCEDLGWKNAEKFGASDVCGSSGNCPGKMSHSSAELFCKDQGARLCSLSEILHDEARATGCGLDDKKIWSSTSCDDGFMIAQGSSKSSSNSKPKCQSDKQNKKKSVRCCADVTTPMLPQPTNPVNVKISSSTCDDLGWKNSALYGEANVCGNSKRQDGSCSDKKKFSSAKNWCENQGARLCTLDELLDDEARATGCGLDNEKVWSSTSCDDVISDGYYVAAGSSGRDMTQCKKSSASDVKFKTRCCADV